MRQQLRALEPFVPLFNANLADSLWLDGQNDAAIAILKDVPGEVRPCATTARIYAAAGRYGEAADACWRSRFCDECPLRKIEWPRKLRVSCARPQRKLPRRKTFHAWGMEGSSTFTSGPPAAPLRSMKGRVKLGSLTLPTLPLLWHPSYAPVRKTERFKAYVRKAGLVEYWRARGWPEFCRPMGADDFVCV